MTTLTKSKTMMMSPIYWVLFAISAGHFINDSLQAVVYAMFPILEQNLHFSYTQIGWVAFVLNMTSSIMQPVFGSFADKRSVPFLLPFGTFLSLLGLVGLALFSNFFFILIAALFIGLGSAIFHPEGSRVTSMAAGGKRGLAQSIYQVGGNTGQAMAPIYTAFILIPFGQKGGLIFSVLAIIGIGILFLVSSWYKNQLSHMNYHTLKNTQGKRQKHKLNSKIKTAMILLVFFVFARSWYHAGISSFYQFYLIEDYGLSITEAQFYLFTFMIAGAIGTLFGGPLADRFGNKNIIMFSMLGIVPFTIALPYVPIQFVMPMFLIVGFIMMTSFSVSVVYAQELMPKNIGMASGLIVGLAFGMGAIGSVFLGTFADMFNIKVVMIFCSFLPIIGIIAMLLPNDSKVREINQSI
ncbi:MFS transporter [Cytobacillus sp. Hm23]